MINVEPAGNHGLTLVCTLCADLGWSTGWSNMSMGQVSVPIEEVIEAALDHAVSVHGLDEIRGPSIERDR